MFAEKGVRTASPSGGLNTQNRTNLDFNRLFMHHEKDISLLAQLPSLRPQSSRYSRSNSGSKSQTVIRSHRRRDVNAVQSADQDKEGDHLRESINVVVEPTLQVEEV